MSNTFLNDNLNGIYEASLLIEERFAKVKSADEFVLSPQGVLLLDSIAMRLQVIGELVKKSRSTTVPFLEDTRKRNGP